MAGISGMGLWGEGRPRFRLLDAAGGGPRRPMRLSGAGNLKFTFTQTSAVVDASEDVSGLLRAGDVLTPNWGAEDKVYFVESVDGDEVTLTENFAEGTQTSVNGFVDDRSLWLPDTTETLFGFKAERNDGGALRVRLNSGQMIDRAEGFRARVTFRWDILTRGDMMKLARIIGHRLVGQIEVIPHEDVKLAWLMTPDDDLAAALPGGKYIGHQVEAGFMGVELLRAIPEAAAAGKWGPLVY